MKVLVQYWTPLAGGELISISKNRKQLDATIIEVAPRKDPEDEDWIINYNKAAEPDGEPKEMKIRSNPKTSALLDMAKSDTVFLCDDEMDIIWGNLPP